MSRTMIRTVQKFGTIESALANMASNTFDLDELTPPFAAFLKRYRSTYPSFQEAGQGYGYQLSEKELKDLENSERSQSPINRPGTADRMTKAVSDAFLTTGIGAGENMPESPQGTRPSSPGDLAAKNGKKKHGADDPPQTIYAIAPPKCTVLMLHDFALECYGMLWTILTRQGNEGLCSITLRFCSKKRLSQRSNDFKLKGFLDFYFDGNFTKDGAALLESSPHAILFGKAVGLLPRRQTSVRKAWGPIAVSVLAFAYIEKCWKASELIDCEGNPTSAEVKTKLNKLQNNRQITVKRAIQIIIKLSEASQPHWTMAPVHTACQEYRARTPWVKESLSRLMHLLIYAALWVNGRIKEVGPSGQSATQVLSTAWSGRDRDNAAVNDSAPPARSEARDAKRDRRGESKDKEEKDDDAPVSVVGVKLLRAIAAKAALLWSARAHNNTGQLKAADIMKFSDRNTFASISLEDASELFGKLSVGVCEVALVCIDAWEAEYVALQADMRKALVSTTRRPAVVGSYDSSNAELTKVERLAMIRILKYYNERDHLGVDWASIKSAAESGEPVIYPFHIPEQLLQKSVAELNFHSQCIIVAYEKDKAREFMEDVVAASGPYAKTPVQATRPPLQSEAGKRALGSQYSDQVPGPLDSEQIKAVHRAEYLAAQTLGSTDRGLEMPLEGAASKYRPLSAAIALPLPMISDDESFCTAVNTVQSAEGDSLDALRSLSGMSDPRPSLHAYMQEKRGDNNAHFMQSPHHAARDHDERRSSEFIAGATDLRAASQGKASRPVSSAEALGFVPPGFSRFRAPIDQPLATVPYASPLPARHAVSMVDVLDLSPELLTRCRLLSRQPVGPGTSKQLLRSLDAELFGSLDALSLTSEPENDGGDDGAVGGTASMKQDSAADLASKQALSDQMTAKQRVWAKMEADRQRAVAKEDKLREARIKARVERQASEPLLPRDPAEYMTKVDVKSALRIGRKGAKTGHDDAVSAESALATEQSVQVLQLIDVPTESVPISASMWMTIADSFLKDFQLEALRKIDLTRARMGPMGAAVLAKSLRRKCCLLDLRLAENDIGDTGCGKVLKAIAAGGGASSLLMLDLASNSLTMTSSALEGLAELSALRRLDLSHNKITMDLPWHHATMIKALKPLSALDALSLSHNKIQDAGLATLLELLADPLALPALGFLDLERCFLTPSSTEVLMKLIKQSPVLKTDSARGGRPWGNAGLQLQGNIFTNDELLEMSHACRVRDIPVAFTGNHVRIDTLVCPYAMVSEISLTTVMDKTGVDIAESKDAGSEESKSAAQGGLDEEED